LHVTSRRAYETKARATSLIAAKRMAARRHPLAHHTRLEAGAVRGRLRFRGEAQADVKAQKIFGEYGQLHRRRTLARSVFKRRMFNEE